MGLIDGVGVARDAVAARAVLAEACKGGFAMSCRNLGVLYREGEGGSRDATAAARTFRRGCDLGQNEACAELAGHYLDGSGVPMDPGMMPRAPATAETSRSSTP